MGMKEDKLCDYVSKSKSATSHNIAVGNFNEVHKDGVKKIIR
jgi:hypothetical protein